MDEHIGEEINYELEEEDEAQLRMAAPAFGVGRTKSGQIINM
jgi:hypothetical protein